MTMRDEVMDLVDRAMSDGEFKAKARADLDGALKEYGYDLTGEEYAAVREFQKQTEGMSGEEVDRALAGNAMGGKQFA